MVDSPARRLVILRHAMKSMLGEKQSTRMWGQIEPVVRDAAGHGEPARDKAHVGDAANPADNFWEGAWQIYEAD